jgi:hypothetical protein
MDNAARARRYMYEYRYEPIGGVFSRGERESSWTLYLVQTTQQPSRPVEEKEKQARFVYVGSESTASYYTA